MYRSAPSPYNKVSGVTFGCGGLLLQHGGQELGVAEDHLVEVGDWYDLSVTGVDNVHQPGQHT